MKRVGGGTKRPCERALRPPLAARGQVCVLNGLRLKLPFDTVRAPPGAALPFHTARHVVVDCHSVGIYTV